jgi:hypothetical protein
VTPTGLADRMSGRWLPGRYRSRYRPHKRALRKTLGAGSEDLAIKSEIYVLAYRKVDPQAMDGESQI